MTNDVETTVQDARIVLDLPDGHVNICVSTNMLRSRINAWITNAVNSVADPANQTPKNQMMRLSLNSVLIAVGPMIAKMFWSGPGEPPKPGRKDDLMEWYVRFAAEQIVASIENSSSQLHLEASGVTNDEFTTTVRIDAIHSRPATGN